MNSLRRHCHSGEIMGLGEVAELYLATPPPGCNLFVPNHVAPRWIDKAPRSSRGTGVLFCCRHGLPPRAASPTKTMSQLRSNDGNQRSHRVYRLDKWCEESQDRLIRKPM